jgi:hypothetical protein
MSFSEMKLPHSALGIGARGRGWRKRKCTPRQSKKHSEKGVPGKKELEASKQ